MPYIPNNPGKKITQLNSSNVLGDLYASFNLDLSENEGLIRIGKRLILNTATGDLANMSSYPVGFAAFNGMKWTIYGTGSGSAANTTNAYPSDGLFAQVLGSGVPGAGDSTLSDLLVSYSELYMTGAEGIVRYTADGTTWNTISIASDTLNPHMLASFLARTYVSQLGSQITSWSKSDHIAASIGSQYTLDLGNTDSNIITFIRPASDRIWIGTVNTLGGKGYIYDWDGSAGTTTKSYRLESSGALSCVIKDDVPYVMDSNGRLIVWNGGTFKTLTKLNRRRNKMLWNALSRVNNRFVHPNGMSLVGGKIHIGIDGRNLDGSATGSSIEETIPSGVYEYDENRGLIHKDSVGSSKSAGTITDYGQTRLAGIGGLSELNIPSANAGRNGTFLLGASYYTTATASTSGVFYDDSNDTLQKAGYLVTTKMRPDASKLGQTTTAMWRKLYLTYRQFLASTDRMVIKFRYVEQEPTQMDITWASTTTFTTSDGNIANYAIGDEVEIVQGNGAGICAHITALSGSGTITVTIDETVASSSATAKARFQKWKKLLEVNDQTSSWVEMGIDPAAHTWVQFKIWVLFTGQDEIETLVPVDAPQQIAQ